MTIAQTLLAEFEQELQTTRKFLERLPHDELQWRPHPKSMTAGQLALHIAGIPGGVLGLAQQDRPALPDLSRPNPQPTSVQEILDALAESAAAVGRDLPTISDERMAEIVSFTVDGQEVMSLPRAACLRSILLNHWYHHRGQFGVYLRLLGAKVPVSYGPSGDERPDFLKA